MKPGDIVHILWEDAHGKSPSVEGHIAWITESELEDMCSQTLEVDTWGMVYKVDSKRVVIVSTKAHGQEKYEDQYGDYVMIPKSSILKSKVYK